MTDLTMTMTSPVVVGGVDTHKELHVVAVVDAQDRVIGTASFSTTRAGYRARVRWMPASVTSSGWGWSAPVMPLAESPQGCSPIFPTWVAVSA